MNRLQRLAGASLLLLACVGARADDDAARWQLQLRSSRHSDFGTLSDIDSEDASRFRARGSRNLAYLDEEARLERRAGRWGLAVLARSTATLTANRGAIEAWRHTRRLDRNGSNRHWDVEGRLRGFSGVGLEVARSFELAPAWQGELRTQGLVLTRWRDRRISGSADYDAAGSRYTFALRSWEVNDHRTFPFMRSFAAHGAGLLFGGELRWKHDDLTLAATVRDLGVLMWDGLPQQTLTLDSSTRSTDAQGFIVYRPLLQGANTQKRVVRGAPARAGASARWQATAADELVASADYVRDFGLLPALAWHRTWPWLRTEVSWQIHERRVTLGAEWRGLRVRFGTDSLGGDPHSRTIEIGYTYLFD